MIKSNWWWIFHRYFGKYYGKEWTGSSPHTVDWSIIGYNWTLIQTLPIRCLQPWHAIVVSIIQIISYDDQFEYRRANLCIGIQLIQSINLNDFIKFCFSNRIISIDGPLFMRFMRSMFTHRLKYAFEKSLKS